MKIIKLLMLYAGCREIGKIMETIIYVALMMITMIFVCILCSIMQ